MCMRTNYDQTLLEQTKIFDPHTYRWSVQHEKPDFWIRENKREFSIKFLEENYGKVQLNKEGIGFFIKCVSENCDFLVM